MPGVSSLAGEVGHAARMGGGLEGRGHAEVSGRSLEYFSLLSFVTFVNFHAFGASIAATFTIFIFCGNFQFQIGNFR